MVEMFIKSFVKHWGTWQNEIKYWNISTIVKPSEHRKCGVERYLFYHWPLFYFLQCQPPEIWPWIREKNHIASRITMHQIYAHYANVYARNWNRYWSEKKSKLNNRSFVGMIPQNADQIYMGYHIISVSGHKNLWIFRLGPTRPLGRSSRVLSVLTHTSVLCEGCWWYFDTKHILLCASLS